MEIFEKIVDNVGRFLRTLIFAKITFVIAMQKNLWPQKFRAKFRTFWKQSLILNLKVHVKNMYATCKWRLFFLPVGKPTFSPPPNSLDFRTKNMNFFEEHFDYQLKICNFLCFSAKKVVRKPGGGNTYRFLKNLSWVPFWNNRLHLLTWNHIHTTKMYIISEYMRYEYNFKSTNEAYYFKRALNYEFLLFFSQYLF